MAPFYWPYRIMVEFVCLSSRRAGIVTRWGYHTIRGVSSVGLERCTVTAKVASSSLVHPAIFIRPCSKVGDRLSKSPWVSSILTADAILWDHRQLESQQTCEVLLVLVRIQLVPPFFCFMQSSHSGYCASLPKRMSWIRIPPIAPL